MMNRKARNPVAVWTVVLYSDPQDARAIRSKGGGTWAIHFGTEDAARTFARSKTVFGETLPTVLEEGVTPATARHWGVTFPVTVQLSPMLVLVLDSMATHLGKTRDETIADALRALFCLLPRPDDNKETTP